MIRLMVRETLDQTIRLKDKILEKALKEVVLKNE